MALSAGSVTSSSAEDSAYRLPLPKASGAVMVRIWMWYLGIDPDQFAATRDAKWLAAWQTESEKSSSREGGPGLFKQHLARVLDENLIRARDQISTALQTVGVDTLYAKQPGLLYTLTEAFVRKEYVAHRERMKLALEFYRGNQHYSEKIFGASLRTALERSCGIVLDHLLVTDLTLTF